jgi:hypothetical protein
MSYNIKKGGDLPLQVSPFFELGMIISFILTPIMPRHRLSAGNKKAIAHATDPSRMSSRKAFSEKMSGERKQAIERWYKESGNLFIHWVKTYYRRWSGEPLYWNEPFQEEYYYLIGNPWIERIVIEKSAQVGFSESMIALAAFTLSEVRVPLGFGFEQERKLRDMVGPRVQAAFDYIEPIQEIRRTRQEQTGRQDTDSKERKITVGGVEATFFYASTAAAQKNASAGQRQASSSLSSFSAWVILADEIELWPKGTLDVATQRQNACEMPTKPMRSGSTPGSEGGVVDSEVKASGHVFQWQVKCPHCEALQFIDPFGNFLKSVKVTEGDGETQEDAFLDAMGKPLDWFCHDDSTREARIRTAYVGCCECGGELDSEALKGGAFHCVNTMLPLREICDRATKTRIPVHKTVALKLPRLASTGFNPEERIRRLLETRSPADEIQQGLGKPISVGSGKISLTRIMACVGATPPDPDRKPDLVSIGVDQGRSRNYVVVLQWYMALEKDPEDCWANAWVNIAWHGSVMGSFEAIDEIVKKWGADFVGMDADPEIQLAASYARKHLPERVKKGQVYLFDEVVLKGEDFRRATREIQGTEVPVYALHRTFGMDAVRDRFNRKNYGLPAGMMYVPGDDDNLIFHLLTSDRTVEGHWIEPPGLPDHWHHAMAFAEVAVLASYYAPRPKRLIFGSLHGK